MKLTEKTITLALIFLIFGIIGAAGSGVIGEWQATYLTATANVSSPLYCDNESLCRTISQLIGGGGGGGSSIWITDGIYATLNDTFASRLNTTSFILDGGINSTLDGNMTVKKIGAGDWSDADERFFTETETIAKFVNRSDWTTHDNYPAACSAGQFISALGDTSTCGTPLDSQLTEEQVQDFAWNVLTGTQERITVTYQDATNTVDFVVNLSDYPKNATAANFSMVTAEQQGNTTLMNGTHICLNSFCIRENATHVILGT